MTFLRAIGHSKILLRNTSRNHEKLRTFVLAENKDGELVPANLPDHEKYAQTYEHVLNFKGKNCRFKAYAIFKLKVSLKSISLSLYFLYLVKTENGESWLLGRAHKILKSDQIGDIGFLNTKANTKWYGFINIPGRKTGYQFEVVSLFF